MRYLLATTFVFQFILLHAQKIDHAASYRNIGSSRYFRLHYENDYFSTTDFYYTQGVNFELVNPKLARTFLPKTLLHFKDGENKYGISLEHLAYTPTNILQSEILDGDRPFVACLMIKPFTISNDSINNRRLVSSFSLGMIGQAAGGKQIQTTIHQWIHDRIPRGWTNQIENDMILNYQIGIEQQVTSRHHFLMSVKAGTNLGTLTTKLHTSTIFMAGFFDNPFQHFSKQTRKYQVYVYAEPILNIVGYDASLQGGIFNRKSPYVINPDNITRIVFQGNTGLVIKVNHFNIEYFQTAITKEFATGRAHYWGGLRIGWMFR